MMVSPEMYYEEFIEGKTRQEIRSEIIDLKNKIELLKKDIENPEFVELMCPSKELQIEFCRKYLEKAIEAYEATGKKYVLSGPDAMTKDFEDNICNIKTIRFVIGGFLDGWIEKICTFEDETVKIETGDLQGLYGTKSFIKTEYYNRSNFINKLRELHLGEWKKRYICEDYGIEIFDGCEWELEIEFSNKKRTLRIEGHECYPYNFNKFRELLGENEDDKIDDLNE